MIDVALDQARWADRLSHLATFVSADALAVVSFGEDGGCTTSAQFNLTRTEWPADEAVALRQTAGSGPGMTTGRFELSNGRIAEHLCVAPLRTDGRLVGALVAARSAGPFDERAGEGMQHAAELTALELAVSVAVRETERQASEAVQQARIRAVLAREVFLADDYEGMLERAPRRLADLFGADRVSIMLLEPSGELVLRASVGLPAGLEGQARRSLGEGIAGWVAQHGEPLLLNGPVAEPRFRGVNPSTGSALVAPLRDGEEILGVVNVKSASDFVRYENKDLAQLVTLAQDLGLALRRARALRPAEDAVDADDPQQAAERDRRFAHVLAELSRLALFEREPKRLLDSAVALVARTLRHDVVGLWLADDSSRRLRLVAGSGYQAAYPGDVEADPVIAAAVWDERPQSVRHPEGARWRVPVASSYALAPLLGELRPVGALVVGRSGDAYVPDEVDCVSTLGVYLGAIVERHWIRSVNGKLDPALRHLREQASVGLTDAVLTLQVVHKMLEGDPDLPARVAKATRELEAYLERLKAPDRPA